MKRLKLLLLIILTISAGKEPLLNAQPLVESIAAVVGNEVIYLSDLEATVTDLKRTGNRTPLDELRCRVFQEMLISKLFVDQARIDSIEVTDDVIEGELNMRINDAIRRAGSQEALEEYFKKSILEIRRDIRRTMIEQEVVREVQSKISENLTMTPSGVKRFYNGIEKDSLPIIPAKYQLRLIQLDPPSNEDNKAEARQRLLDLRSQILEGKSFTVLARLYSEDKESAKNGGEIGYLTRGELDKEYANAAFSLTKNTVSKVIESKFGFHLIQLIDRKGDMVNTRHILIRPQVKPNQAEQAISKLDSIADLIRRDSMKFEEAAIRFSTHKDSRMNGGRMVNPNPSDRVTWLTLEELNTEMYMNVRELKLGEISKPFKTTDDNNNPVFRIVKLDSEIPAHKANPKDDYQVLYDAALMEKRQKMYDDWITKKVGITYIRISEEYKTCDFLQKGWIK